MSKNTVLIYVGKGNYIAGWPARDLTAADIDHLKKEGVTIDQLLQSKLYEYPPIPAAKTAVIKPKAVESEESGEE